MIALKPLSDRVIIKQTPVEEKTKSGIILPGADQREKPEQGEVIAIGINVQTGIKKGDNVIFSKYAPVEIKIDNEAFLVVKEEDIMAVINQ